MDINGIKPIANRTKQTGVGAKTKTHFGGHSNSRLANGILVPPAVPRVKATTPRTEYHAPVIEQAEQLKLTATLKHVRQTRRHLKRRTILLRSAASCFVVVVALLGLIAWNGYGKVHKIFHATPTVAALASKSTSQQEALLNGQADGRINILLSGVNGTGTSQSDLTDTVTLLSIDPINYKATIVNIPTDLWVQQPVDYVAHQQELNVVYQNGETNYLGQADPTNANPDAVQAGLKNLDQVVERVTGVTVDYNLLINLQGLKQAIDTVGGINVNVPSELYDSSLAWKESTSPLIAKPGMQVMNGDQALLYIRSRQTQGGVTQVQRELQVLTALKDKAFSVSTWSNPTKLESLLGALGNNAYSDMGIGQAEQLYAMMNKVNDANMSSIDLIGPSLNLLSTEKVGDLSVAIPAAGFNNYAAIQEYVRGYMTNGYLAQESAPVTVVSTDATGAAIAGSMLKSYGYNVTLATTTAQRVSHLTLVDLSNGKDPLTLQALEAYYHTTAVSNMPYGVNVTPGNAKFVIIEP